jgi:hypothetical protein
MLSNSDEWENTTEVLTVQCPEGHVGTKSYNHFVSAESRCRECVNLSMTHSQEYVAEQFSIRGFVLLEVYVNATISMKYRCHCGRISSCCYNGLIKTKTNQCIICLRIERKAPWSMIEEYFEKSGCILITIKENYVDNTQPLEYVCSCGVYWCTSWKDYRKGARCENCANEKRKATLVELYGEDNYFKTEAFKKQNKEHWNSTHGVDHNMKIEEIKEKARQTSTQNHGVPYKFATPEIKALALAAFLEKNEDPAFRKMVRDKYKATCIKRYGVTHTSKCPTIMHKIMAASYLTKEFIFPSGRLVGIQGYENFCLTYLMTEEKIEEDDIAAGDYEVPTIKYYYADDDDSHTYYPDIYIKSQNRIVEVKSEYTYNVNKAKNYAKWYAARDAGYTMDVYIFGKHGKKDKKGYLVQTLHIGQDVELMFDEKQESVVEN